MTTVQEAIVTPALKEIAVIAESETPSSGASDDAFARLNRFLKRLSAEKLAIPVVTRTTWTITASDGSYTVGSGADINIARPSYVNHVGYIDTSTDPDTEHLLEKLSETTYAQIKQKALTSTYPTHWYYTPTYANARLELWPVPTSSTLSGVIYHPTALTTFASLATTVTVPPEWEEMLVTNLALLLCPQFERQPSPVLIQAARDSLAVVKRINKRPVELQFPAFTRSGLHTYDITRE